MVLGGLVFKAHRLVYHSTLGLRVIRNIKKKKTYVLYGPSMPRLERGTPVHHVSRGREGEREREIERERERGTCSGANMVGCVTWILCEVMNPFTSNCMPGMSFSVSTQWAPKVNATRFISKNKTSLSSYTSILGDI